MKSKFRCPFCPLDCAKCLGYSMYDCLICDARFYAFSDPELTPFLIQFNFTKYQDKIKSLEVYLSTSRVIIYFVEHRNHCAQHSISFLSFPIDNPYSINPQNAFQEANRLYVLKAFL